MQSGDPIFLIGILPALVLIVAGFLLWPSTGVAGGTLIVLGALVLCVALLISKALSGIFGVALYRYALDGQVVGGFTQEDLESAVRPKRGAKHPGATLVASDGPLAKYDALYKGMFNIDSGTQDWEQRKVRELIESRLRR